MEVNSNHPLYGVYRNILNRCYRESNDNYRYYGGRGVVVCGEWLTDYGAFASWALESGWSKGLQVDRIDNDGSYSPENCRITTCAENTRNSRSAKLTSGDVLKIRKLLKGGVKHREIAESFPVQRSAITRINTGIRWAV